ncbi:MAG TPA: hydrogen peroxide-dependent heme synthase [Gemmatimonadaceae bacterium]|nr:hydrogen peroxide-dependent heme synthase [Gemmatimonadaceae bacterium]
MERALPPETAEGWWALHQMYTVDRRALRRSSQSERDAVAERSRSVLERVFESDTGTSPEGWSTVVELTGAGADVMLLHFRPTLDDLTRVQRQLACAPLSDFLLRSDSFLSVTEAGFYHLTAQLAREAAARGGKVGDAQHREALERKLKAELESDHVRRRLYPERPDSMPYVCFYPMDKKRETGQNWYAQPVDERSRMMHEHGLSGRRYAGRIFQVITGSIGLADWEWGVTLFAKDPLDFKKIVSDMRFDEASAKYGEFGSFFVGKIREPGEWVAGMHE